MSRGLEEYFDEVEEMASNGLCDQDRLEGASNYVIWKLRIEFLLDEHDLKALIDSAVAEPLDAAHLR